MTTRPIWISILVSILVLLAGCGKWPPVVRSTNLTHLDLRGCTNITDRGLEYLGARTNWQMISLGGCPNISFESVARLKSRFPQADIDRDDKEWKYHQ